MRWRASGRAPIFGKGSLRNRCVARPPSTSARLAHEERAPEAYSCRLRSAATLATGWTRAERFSELALPIHSSHHRVIRLTNCVKGARTEFCGLFLEPTFEGFYRDETGVTRARVPLTMGFQRRSN